MTTKESILREEIRRVIRQIIEAETEPEEDEVPVDDEEETPEEAPADEEEETPEEEENYDELIMKLTGKYLNKLKEIPTSDTRDNVVNAASKVIGGFGFGKEDVIAILKGVKNNLIQ